MKKLLLLTLIYFCVLACTQSQQGSQAVYDKSHLAPKQVITDEPLLDPVDHGLHKITINDSTTILLYRGVESCTMIQLK
jgi:hypothetical protein